MIGIEEAMQRIVETTQLLDVVETDVAEAHGRALAEAVPADRDFPPTDRSAMDGFAVKANDVREAGSTLEVVGEIKAHKPGEADEWTAAEIELMETLAEQLDMALESARLYEDTQDRATRDRLIGDVSARIRETLDMDTVLRTAAQEIRQALDLHDLTIELGDGTE